MPYGSALTPPRPLSATPEMMLSIEQMLVALYRIGKVYTPVLRAWVDAEYEHRCWLEHDHYRIAYSRGGPVLHDRTICACGQMSWLDMRSELVTMRITRSGRIDLKGRSAGVLRRAWGKRKATRKAETPAQLDREINEVLSGPAPGTVLTENKMRAIVNRMIDAALGAP
jgi:hypothetical protein